MLDERHLQHQITDEQLRKLNEEGYFIVENALPPALVERLETRVDGIYCEHLEAGYDPYTKSRMTPHHNFFLSELPRHRSAFCEYLGLV